MLPPARHNQILLLLTNWSKIKALGSGHIPIIIELQYSVIETQVTLTGFSNYIIYIEELLPISHNNVLYIKENLLFSKKTSSKLRRAIYQLVASMLKAIEMYSEFSPTKSKRCVMTTFEANGETTIYFKECKFNENNEHL